MDKETQPVKGYKAVNMDMSSSIGVNPDGTPFMFVVNREYEINGEIKLGENGFHMCTELADVSSSYSISNARIFEAIGYGKLLNSDSDTTVCAQKIRLQNELPKDDILYYFEANIDNIIESGSIQKIRTAIALGVITEELVDSIIELNNTALLHFLASSTNTPAYVLDRIIKECRQDVKVKALANPKCPIKTIEKWIGPGEEIILCAIAENPVLPAELLEILSFSCFWSVKNLVAAHSNTSEKILDKLVSDSNEYVRISVICNHNSSEKTLEKAYDSICNEKNSSTIASYIASNPSTSPEVLAKLAKHKDYNVRLMVARNQRTPKYILKMFENDENWFVKTNASMRIKEQDVNQILDIMNLPKK